MEKNIQKSTLNRSGAIRRRCESGIEKYINNEFRWKGREQICFQLLQQYDDVMAKKVRMYTFFGKNEYFPIEYKETQ